MEAIIHFLLVLGVVGSNAYVLQWPNKFPLKEVVEIHERTTIKKIYDTEISREMIQFQETYTIEQKNIELSVSAGKNCGQHGKSETIYIDSISMPDTLVLGANGTFSAEVTVNGARKSASLLSLVMRKVGLPFDIPCAKGFGSCNYTNPCQILEKIQCPKAIIDKGWNCRCPIKVNHYSFGPITALLPTVPLPAFLVNGNYEVIARLYDGADELLCYDLTVTVKEK